MSETLVTIGKYLDVTEAHIAAGLLQSEGIPVRPLDIDHLSANSMPGVGLGSVRLQVPASFAQEARRLLANRDSSDGAQLSYLATGEASDPGEVRDDQIELAVFRMGNLVKRKEFWIYLVSFDIVFFALALLVFWTTA